MSRLDLIAIAKETMKFTENFIKETGCEDCAKVEVFSPKMLQDIEEDVDEFFERSFYGTDGASYYVVDSDSFEAACGLKRPLVMNFANAHSPGGGFLNGARAQEESLCRCSTLYKSISSDDAKEMYDYNNKLKEPCDSDYMLLSPDVYVFRTYTGQLLDFPYWTSVVTVPAPNKCGAASKVPQEVLDDVMLERLRKMLYLAARKGYRNLVLGAWGCGAFGNDTRRVAEYYHELFFGIDRFDEFFDNVIFAILGDADKINIFKEVFSDKINNSNPDEGFLIEPDMEDEPVGYYQSKFEYPVCNHTEGITKNNIGFTRGITASGVPFEAELFKEVDAVTMAVIMPAIYNDAYEGMEDDELSDENINITSMHYEVESFDYSVLDIGMVDDAMEENTDVVKDYVDFLVKNGIVTYASNLINGAVLYRVDVLGNEIAKILVTMQEGEDLWAYTDLQFDKFPKLHKSNKKPVFKVIRNENN